ncbi:hypothetical protein MTR67_019354 [Solanum verrucosum]|uniref:Uncharacterized protein n=1 Tax=Solanum verrucosum TaxID=315347 RepID=A0AAF0QU55_SOLVR|nr:hypothetical protein MTR67_019354 [Solanum verrucosum]
MRCIGHITVQTQPLEDYSEYSLE